jgi:hypothetical protein
VIAVCAPPAERRFFYNSILRDAVSTADRERISWTGNLLFLSSSLQPEVDSMLGGMTRDTLTGKLQVRA